MTGVIDTEKKLTYKVPFYSVTRDSWGWVRACVKPVRQRCKQCLLFKYCLVKGARRKDGTEHL